MNSATENSASPGQEFRSRLCLFGVLFAWVTLPLLAHAGGLGIAPSVAIAGGIGLLASWPWHPRKTPVSAIAVAVFLGWAIATSFWSAYVDPNALTNPVKIGVGVILFFGIFPAAAYASSSGRPLLRRVVISIAFLMIALLIIDLLTHHGITFMVDPPREGENVLRKHGDAEMNLGHSVTVLALLLPIVSMMIWREFKHGKIVSIAFVILALIAAILAKLFAGILAIIVAVLVMFLARRFPKFTYGLVFWSAIISILAAPLIGIAMGYVSDDMKAAMPFSWEHRVEMWAHVYEQIKLSPIWGHGFDAVRTFDATFSSRGIENWAVVSLHPHNAGMHIWVETGAIGAVLASVAIFVIGRAAKPFVFSSLYRTIAISGFITALICVASMTYGVWQDWWWAAIMLVGSSLWFLPGSRPARD